MTDLSVGFWGLVKDKDDEPKGTLTLSSAAHIHESKG